MIGWDDILKQVPPPKKKKSPEEQNKIAIAHRQRTQERRQRVERQNNEREVSRTKKKAGDLASTVQQDRDRILSQLNQAVANIQNLKALIGPDPILRMQERSLLTAVAALGRYPNLSINDEHIRQALLRQHSPKKADEMMRDGQYGR